MPKLVTNGTVLKCSFGTIPTILTILPKSGSFAAKMPIANIDDHGIENVLSFGVCMAKGPAFPPCIANISGSWIPGVFSVNVCSKPILTNSSKCFCSAGGGCISISSPGATSVDVQDHAGLF